MSDHRRDCQCSRCAEDDRAIALCRQTAAEDEAKNRIAAIKAALPLPDLSVFDNMHTVSDETFRVLTTDPHIRLELRRHGINPDTLELQK